MDKSATAPSSLPLSLPYHEKQSALNQMCLVHTLNMLLGDKIFSKASLDAVCEQLTEKKWFNPHRSPLGLGNYDVNVAISAMEPYLLDVSFVDPRSPLDAQSFVLSKTNLLVNTQGSWFIPGSRHWFAYRYYEGNWFRLDSGKSGPILVQDMDAELDLHKQRKDYILSVIPSNSS